MRSPRSIIVVGGGPAGALTAWVLARAGRDVTLLERRAPSAGKTCGQCLSPAACRRLEDAGLGRALRTLSDGPTRALSLHLRRAGRLVASTSGRLVDRGRFDQGLRDLAAGAGARVVQPAVMTAIDAGRHGVRVTARTAAGEIALGGAMVVGADGLRSRVARAFARGAAGNAYGFSFDLPGDGTVVAPHTIAMHFTEAGYLGLVRQNRGLHVAGLVRPRGASAAARDPLGFARAVAGTFPELRGTALEGRLVSGAVRGLCACGPMPWRPGRIAGPNFALVGDAAGYAEPFTGEGMAWAILGAALLADAMSASTRWDERSAGRYEREHRRLIGRRHVACRWLGAVLARPALFRATWHLGRRRPALVEALARSCHDRGERSLRA